MQLDEEQQLAVLAPRGPVCILAGAGTGKTRTITHRIGRLVDTGRLIRAIFLLLHLLNAQLGRCVNVLPRWVLGNLGGILYRRLHSMRQRLNNSVISGHR